MKKDTFAKEVSLSRIINLAPPSPYRGQDPVDLREANALYQRYCEGEITLSDETINACLEVQREEINQRRTLQERSLQASPLRMAGRV